MGSISNLNTLERGLVRRSIIISVLALWYILIGLGVQSCLFYEILVGSHNNAIKTLEVICKEKITGISKLKSVDIGGLPYPESLIRGKDLKQMFYVYIDRVQLKPQINFK